MRILILAALVAVTGCAAQPESPGTTGLGAPAPAAPAAAAAEMDGAAPSELTVAAVTDAPEAFKPPPGN